MISTLLITAYPMMKTFSRCLDPRVIKRGSEQDSELQNLILFWMTFIALEYLESAYEIILSLHWLYWVLKAVIVIAVVKYHILYLAYESTFQAIFLSNEDRLDKLMADVAVVNTYVNSAPMTNLVAIPHGRRHDGSDEDSSSSSSVVSSDDEDILEMQDTTSSKVPSLELKKNE
eukprot:TRINITY_DN1208_c0_g1_i1.p1 TRINITY_DN1208_c0_g1~~TRINITY_DN1208_c0_g1_i1.p1  ORF type:complete len:174 (+),score=20.68 TRINITY_DN1208_c0_g1_i1:1261-1782(+)